MTTFEKQIQMVKASQWFARGRSDLRAHSIMIMTLIKKNGSIYTIVAWCKTYKKICRIWECLTIILHIRDDFVRKIWS